MNFYGFGLCFSYLKYRIYPIFDWMCVQIFINFSIFFVILVVDNFEILEENSARYVLHGSMDRLLRPGARCPGAVCLVLGIGGEGWVSK